MRASLFAGCLALPVLGCGTGATSERVATGAGGAAASSAVSSGAGPSGSPATSASTASSAASGGGGAGGGGGGAIACSAPSPGPGSHAGTILSGGAMRTYVVHVPPSYDATKRTQVVLLFHGLTQTSSGIEDQTQMDPVSDAHGFLTVYPQGLNASWNAGACCGLSSSGNVDDVQFTSDLLDQLAKDYCVDEKRVFSSGFSNGGMLSHRLACELSDRIAAIGAVSGTLAIPTCAPPRPVPVLHIHGTGDIVVGYSNGGFSGADGVPKTIATWVGIDGCTDAVPATVFMMGDATCTEYKACKAGTNVELCSINNGGHQWPGGKTDFIGNLSTSLDASETIAAFFAAHPMP